MVSNIELAGLVLIIVGVLYTFLKALGKFSSKVGEEGEIESKMFTLKGGPGLILVGLGVLLLIIGAVAEKPASAPDSASDSTSLNPPSAQPAAIEITPDYLVGRWIATNKDANLGMGWAFFQDGTYIGVYIDNDQKTSASGRYTLTGSRLTVTNDETGKKTSFFLTYIDEDTLDMDGAVFKRTSTPTEQPTAVAYKRITKDYITGEWIKSDGTYNWMFYSDGSFFVKNTSSLWSGTGRYTLTGSTLEYSFDSGGETYSGTLAYIDENTFKLGEAVYYRRV